jgi:hypothetical protein
MRTSIALVALLLLGPRAFGADATTRPTGTQAVKVVENDDEVRIETDALSATIRKKGYVSGIAAGSFVDKRTGAHDLGFGLHIMDFLLAPGWRDDGYERTAAFHGNLPKHYVEGPQLCTQAKQLPVEVLRGDGFAAVRLRYTYTRPGDGFKAGSRWEQTIVFQPGVRYVLSAERITSANDVDDLFYRIDMPGHIRHKAGDTFSQVYLSYPVDGGRPVLSLPKGQEAGGTIIPASAFAEDFAPDVKFFYLRKDDAIPKRMIRAYQVKLPGPDAGKPGPWLAGMTLDPAEAAEAWCHQRGYVCFIEELHRRHVKSGETFGAAYVIGWFDSVTEMNQAYDRYKGKKAIVIEGSGFWLE